MGERDSGAQEAAGRMRTQALRSLEVAGDEPGMRHEDIEPMLSPENHSTRRVDFTLHAMEATMESEVAK